MSAQYMLQLENIKTYKELMTFLEELSNKWPAYKAVYILVKEVETKVADQTTMDKVLTEIKKYQ